MSKFKYVVYCRKSSEEDTKQIQSLEIQVRLLCEYAQTSNLTVIDTFQESRSAKTDDNRPLFTQMLHRIRNGEAQGILVAHIDRLSRNGIESGQIIKLFEQGFLKEIRTPSRIYNSVQDLLYMDFDFVFASHYSRNLSIRVKEGIQTKLIKGEYPSCAPIGYINKDGKIYPDPVRSLHIQQAYELYANEEYTLKQLAEVLHKKGFRTRGANKKVHKAVIYRILTDPIYYGAIRRKGTIYKGIHTPIVSLALFNKVQDIFTGKNRSKKQKHDFLYRGYLTCAVCGCVLTASIKKGQYKYYYCTNGKGICFQHRDYLPELRVHALLRGLTGKFLLEEKLTTLSLEQYESGLRTQFTSGISFHSLLDLQLGGVQKKLDRLLNKYLEEKIDDVTYDQKQKDLLKEKTNIELQLKNSKPQDPDTTLELVHKFKNEAISLQKMYTEGNDKIRGELLKSLLWNLTLEDGKITSEKYKLPWHYLKDLHKTSDISVWRRGRDSNSR